MKMVTCAEMRVIENDAFSRGATAAELMETVGWKMAQVILKRHPQNGKVVAYLGKGNNAGDALVILRHLYEHGWTISVRMECLVEELSELSQLNYRLIENHLSKPSNLKADILLDGLLGIGGKGGLRDPLLGLAAEMNDRRHQGARVYAVDIPSGMNADEGNVYEGAVIADVTMTVACVKQGLLNDHAIDHIGEIELIEINELPAPSGDAHHQVELITDNFLRSYVRRPPFSQHKGMAGRVGIIAGSRGMLGAAALAAKGALRGGAGLVTLFVEESLYCCILPLIPVEVMTIPAKSLSEVIQHKFDALVIGPGLGNSIFLSEIKDLLDAIDYPIVLDADALNWIAENQYLDHLKENHIVTPHPGEMVRMLPESTSLSREETAKSFVQQYDATLLYKGSRTIVANKKSAIYYNTTGSPGMASGGQGDALSGLLAALLGRKHSPLEAACASAYIAGKAATIAIASGESEESLIASDVLDRFGKAFLWIHG